jgi:hypothetical protein
MSLLSAFSRVEVMPEKNPEDNVSIFVFFSSYLKSV